MTCGVKMCQKILDNSIVGLFLDCAVLNINNEKEISII